MELFKLVGVLFVVVGFILKWDTIATVVAAGIITGLVAMMNGTMTFIEIFETLGSSFVSQRTATLFGLTVGIIGICERYGLKDKAVDFIKKLSKLTTGGLLSVWLIIRTLSAAFSLRLGVCENDWRGRGLRRKDAVSAGGDSNPSRYFLSALSEKIRQYGRQISRGGKPSAGARLPCGQRI